MGSRHRAPERQINRMETQHHFRYWQILLQKSVEADDEP
jgi:hypothetical protein